jgi:transposase
VDESGVNACLQREYGRALRGEQINGARQGNQYERVNVIGALCGGRHYAVECYSRTTNSELFEDWFENRLLKAIPKGFTIIMDNASFHRKEILRKLARGKARLLFLPPYSPDYNPIEKTWANMKRFLRNNSNNFLSAGYAIYDYFSIPVI